MPTTTTEADRLAARWGWTLAVARRHLADRAVLRAAAERQHQARVTHCLATLPATTPKEQQCSAP